MFAMQVDIAVGASLLIPGGELMYSTCSIDPAENEAAGGVLRRCPYLEGSDSSHGLVLHDGRTEWPVLDESGNPQTARNSSTSRSFNQAISTPPARRTG